ncbi:TetR/AcrR family transcriptional regulator [Aromatoleum aromaticum]|uniref:Probable transcriptional regulator of paa operon n=1 Tax=Aromatoleum aromaticum (strain DSM 19018 / LMG 30748 / EbN1) TaxID=76114 RepID=Q5P3I4_AROAE|nr:TetR/AcrR family transcriptional regulator [Aromatoleum aromaticum]NMG54627.1 TetR family transcriptional regulator [Aromatoleum aromaticum]CAI08130.1 probable transcriptional regulator of paa operon [Aromatoleum aromaticum EbN1]
MARGKAPTFELQRAAILDAAAALFAQKGFHNASMSALAEACGVSKPLLYHYYRDKEHILFDIADSYIDRLLAIIDGVVARGLDDDAHLSELVTRFMEEYEHAHDQHIVIVQDVKFLQQEQAAKIAAKQRRVVSAFADAIVRIEPGLKGRKLERPVAMILFGMINWTFTWMRTDGRLTFRDMAPVVTGIFLNGVKGFVEQSGRVTA